MKNLVLAALGAAAFATSFAAPQEASARWYDICWNAQGGYYDHVCADRQSAAEQRQFNREYRSGAYTNYGYTGLPGQIRPITPGVIVTWGVN